MKKIYTTGEVAKILGLNINTIIKWFDDGKIKGFKLPGSNERRIPAKSLMEFMRVNEIPMDFLEKEGYVPENEDRKYQRKAERRSTAIPAELILSNGKETYAKPAKILNLSRGGALVEILSKSKLILPKPPFTLNLKVFQGDLEGFDGQCDMVHINNKGENIAVGLQFNGTPPDRLSEFLGGS
jgi:excisionase family DNA binding protein